MKLVFGLGLFVLMLGVGYLTYRLLQGSSPWYGKTLLTLFSLVLIVLSFDNAWGLTFAKPYTATVVSAEAEAPSNRLFVLVPGYNGRGQHLLAALAPFLAPYGDVMSFEGSTESYDNGALLDTIEQEINGRLAETPNTKLVFYGESYGGQMLADAMRRNPDWHLERWIFNATPDRLDSIKLGSNALVVTKAYYGGPITTWIFQQMQANGLKDYEPNPEPGVDPAAVQAANDASLTITAPLAIGQLRAMANFSPPQPGEFDGRVDSVRYTQAPDPYGEGDTLIKLSQASAAWEAAFSPGLFTNEAMDTPEGTHTPTPEYPSQVADQILAGL